MFGRPYRIVLLLLLVVLVSSCHKSYSTFSMKPAKVKNYKHPGHQWKKRHGRPRIWRGNGYWHNAPQQKQQPNSQLLKY